MVNYVFKQYQSFFPEIFEQEKERLEKFLFESTTIEHFGSTAVKGLGGKGNIDIYVIVPRELIDETKKRLEKAGYEARPNSGTNDRFIYVNDLPDPIEKERRYNVHLASIGSVDFRKCIAFRDYLRNNPKVVAMYAEIKQNAATSADNKKDEYVKMKKPLMDEIQRLADQS